MNKIAIPLIALVSLSIGIAICSIAYVNYAKDTEKQESGEEKTVQHRYEMPKLMPAVWMQGH